MPPAAMKGLSSVEGGMGTRDVDAMLDEDVIGG